jgi:hypothetical protein
VEAPSGVEPLHHSFAERPKMMTTKRDHGRLMTMEPLWREAIKGLGMGID